MNIRMSLVGMLIAGAVHALPGATTPAELVFEVTSAAKAQNPAALQKCFSLEGAETSMKASLRKVIEEICQWPSPYITTTQREGEGPARTEINGHPHELNGNWTFQIHIHQSKPPSRGFVLPAGMTPDGRCAILVSVPQ